MREIIIKCSGKYADRSSELRGAGKNKANQDHYHQPQVCSGAVCERSICILGRGRDWVSASLSLPAPTTSCLCSRGAWQMEPAFSRVERKKTFRVLMLPPWRVTKNHTQYLPGCAPNLELLSAGSKKSHSVLPPQTSVFFLFPPHCCQQIPESSPPTQGSPFV